MYRGSIPVAKTNQAVQAKSREENLTIPDLAGQPSRCRRLGATSSPAQAFGNCSAIRPLMARASK